MIVNMINETVHQSKNLSEGTAKAKKSAMPEKRNVGRLDQFHSEILFHVPQLVENICTMRL